MTREPENEIIAGKELNEIIAAAKELGIKLANAKPGSELWEEAWGDPAKHGRSASMTAARMSARRLSKTPTRVRRLSANKLGAGLCMVWGIVLGREVA